ncbi:MAG: hypothetical protein AAFQ27_11485 [Pseudomonadota bacterium]
MKQVQYRSAVLAIRKACRKNGIEFEERGARGGGSHGSWYFTGSDGKPVRLVVSHGKEISPGVQRSALCYLTDRMVDGTVREANKELMETLFEILKAAFGG